MNDIDWNDIEVAHEAIRYSPGCLFWKDKIGCYQGCNLNFAVLAGKSDPKEVVGKKDIDLSWKERAEEIKTTDAYVMQNDKEISFREEIPLPSGGTVVYETRKRALKVDGNIVGVVGYSVDITEQENKAKFYTEFSQSLTSVLGSTGKK